MKRIITILLLILLSARGYAESFTILAKSGLNVRKEPNAISEKIGKLPFGTVVNAEISYTKDLDYRGQYKHVSEVIEGKRGFWMKIVYGKMEGYIFSGFGLVGEWVIKSTTINKEYRMLQPGKCCDPVNFDPNLNWYALTKHHGKLSVTKTEVTLRLLHEYTAQDTAGESNEFWASFPLTIQTNQKDTVLFLIGSNSPLLEGKIVTQFLADFRGYANDKIFLFPEQTYTRNYEGTEYQFRAFEDVQRSNTTKEGFIRQYQIEVAVRKNTVTNTYNISKELALEGPAAPHCLYHTPQLIMVGDINNDGLSDFIYYTHTMTESCGVCGEYHLFLSDKSNPFRPFRKVAEEVSCNCIT